MTRAGGKSERRHLSPVSETRENPAPEQRHAFGSQGAEGRQPTGRESRGLGNSGYRISMCERLLCVICCVYLFFFFFFSDNLVVKSGEESEAQAMPSTSVQKSQGCRGEQACPRTSHNARLLALSMGGHFTKGYTSSRGPKMEISSLLIYR